LSLGDACLRLAASAGGKTGSEIIVPGLDAGGLMHDVPRSVFGIEDTNRKNDGKEVRKAIDEPTRF
jgi:hypothetical protein